MLQQLLLQPWAVNMAVMLHQQLLQQLLQTLAAVQQLLQLQVAVELLLQLQVDAGCWQNQSWPEEMC